MCMCALRFDNLIVIKKLFIRAGSFSVACREIQAMAFWSTEL